MRINQSLMLQIVNLTVLLKTKEFPDTILEHNFKKSNRKIRIKNRKLKIFKQKINKWLNFLHF